jgi:ABC-2 type transport system permease protein
MRANIWAIARRELQSYFDSPVAYIVLVAFLLLSGWMFFSPLFLLGHADMRTLFAPAPFGPTMLWTILAPAITMRLVADERRSGTLELLLTLPVRDAEVIAGKFLASWALILVALGGTGIWALSVASLGKLDWGPVLSGYFGLAMFSASLTAVGLWCSTLTDKQIVAFIVGFATCSVLYFVYWLQFFVPQSLAGLFEYLSVSAHLENPARGIIDSRDVLFFVSLTGLSLFFATRRLAQQHA